MAKCTQKCSKFIEFSCCPVRLARTLFVEKIIDKKQLQDVHDEMGSEEKQKAMLIEFMNIPDYDILAEYTKGDVKKLRVFATLLIRFNDSQKGRQLLLDCANCDDWQNDSGQCDSKNASFNKMIKEVSCCFQDASLDDIVTGTRRYEELHNEIKLAKSSPEAVNIISAHLSLLNMSYLEIISKYFELVDATSLIEKYQSDVLRIDKMTLKDANHLPLMPNKQQLLISEEIVMELDWNADSATCCDLKILLCTLFGQMCRHVMPYSVVVSSCVIVRCYAPPYLHGVLYRLANDNKEECKPMNVLSISIGGAAIWDRTKELEIEKNLCLVQQENKRLEKDLKEKECYVTMFKNMRLQMDVLTKRSQVMAEQDTKKKKSIPDSQDVPAEQNIHVSDGSQNLMTYHGMSKCEEETRRVALRTSSIYTSPHTDQHSHDLDKWLGF